MGIDKIVRKTVDTANRVSRDIIPGLLENIETQNIPPKVERVLESDKAEQFAASLITKETREKLDALVSAFPDGTYRSREAAGTPEDGSRHVHDFVIEKSGPSTRLYFIDPEHATGKSVNRGILPRRGDLRPQVNVLFSAELLKDDPVPRIALLRYRAAAIGEDKQHLNKPAAQLETARTMLTNGELPEFLQGKENQISFRLDLRSEGDKHNVIVQARAVRNELDVENMVEKLTAGKSLPAHDPLEGQATRFRSIMRTHFPNHLRAGTFESIKLND